MNFSPQNQQSLLDLVIALKNGMDPSQAYGVATDVFGQQAQAIAARQQRLSGLADMLSGVAMQGMPFSGASALAEAQPGPAGPAVQSMLQSLYPTASQSPPMNANGQVMDQPEGNAPTASGFTSRGYPTAPATPASTLGIGEQALSPAFQPAPPSPTEQIAVQDAAQQQAMAEAFQQFAVDASKLASQGMDMQTFLLQAAQAYPDLFSSPEGIKQVQQIALTVFNAPTAQGV